MQTDIKIHFSCLKPLPEQRPYIQEHLLFYQKQLRKNHSKIPSLFLSTKKPKKIFPKKRSIEQSKLISQKAVLQENLPKNLLLKSRLEHRKLTDSQVKNLLDRLTLPKIKNEPQPSFEAKKLSFRVRTIDEQKYLKLLKKENYMQVINSKKDYCDAHGLSRDIILFYFESPDSHMSAELVGRGWHLIPSLNDLRFARFVYTCNDSLDIYRRLSSGQSFNHFENNSVLTSKSGLHELVSKIKDNESFYPSSYEAFQKQDVSVFKNRFFAILTFKLLRQHVNYFRNKIPNRMQLIQKGVLKSLHFCGPKKEFKLFLDFFPSKFKRSQASFDKNFQVNILLIEQLLPFWETIAAQLISISDDFKFRNYKKYDKQSILAFETFSEFAMANDLCSDSQRLQLPADYHEFWKTPNEYLIFKLTSLFCLFERHIPHFDDLFNSSNQWILKPTSKSKGVGVVLSNKLSQINQLIKSNPDRIIQKYIERPLLVQNQFKFDLRLWLLVTSLVPLRAFYFSNYYLRVCPEEYSTAHHNLTAHLTNYSLNKNHFTDSSKSVISSAEFERNLMRENGVDFQRTVLPKIKRMSVEVLLAARKQMIHRDQSFEIYGLDVLLDQQMRPWLLEINKSPACEERTCFLKTNLEEMARGLFDKLLDTNKTSLDDIDQVSQKKDKENGMWEVLVEENEEESSNIIQKKERSLMSDNMTSFFKVEKVDYGVEFIHEQSLRKHYAALKIWKIWKIWKQKQEIKN